MTNYTTKDIIKILPLEDQYRKNLLEEYDSYDEAKKYEVSSVCWKKFNEMTEQLAEKAYDFFLEEVAAGKRTMSPTLMEEAYKEVHAEYEDIINVKKV